MIYRFIFYFYILFNFHNCFDIFQTIEISKDKVLKSSIRMKIFLKDDKKPVDIPIKPMEFKEYPNLKSKINNISNENYTGFDFNFSVPLKDLTNSINVKNKEFPLLPNFDKFGQLVFPFIKKDQIEKVEDQSDKIARGILGMYSYKIYFHGEWKPKAGIMINLNTYKKTNIEIAEFGNGVLLDIPLSFIFDNNNVLILSPSKKINSSGIKSLASKLIPKTKTNEIPTEMISPPKPEDKKDSDEEEEDEDY